MRRREARRTDRRMASPSLCADGASLVLVLLFVLLLPPESRPAFGISRFLQANFFRSNAVYVATVLFACVLGTGAYEGAFEAAWEINNKGKLYKDIIKNYPGLPPNTEPEGGAPAEEEAAEEAAEE